MRSTIACPTCKTEIEISEALREQVSRELIDAERAKWEKDAAERKAIGDREAAERIKVMEEAVARSKKELEASRQLEIDLRKEKNRLEEEKERFEVEKQRQLDAERKTIREKALSDADEQHRLKDKEKELVIEQLKKALEDAQRKAAQGSQQAQGEVQELDLEESFRREFPTDTIEPVGKGVHGADIRHTVKSQTGVLCGVILWESKRTKAWSDEWITKLKDDLRADRANIPAIISEVMPKDAKRPIELKDGVWVTTPPLALPLAALLRKSLYDAAREKTIAGAKATKAEQVFAYVTSHEFTQQVESVLEAHDEMVKQIARERKAFEAQWSEREKQLMRIVTGVSGFIGSMRGVVGQALPPIRSLELPNGE